MEKKAAEYFREMQGNDLKNVSRIFFQNVTQFSQIRVELKSFVEGFRPQDWKYRSKIPVALHFYPSQHIF